MEAFNTVKQTVSGASTAFCEHEHIVGNVVLHPLE